MTIVQVAKSLGLKVRTIRQWVIDGKLQAKKVSGKWIVTTDIDSEEVQELADKARKHSERVKIKE